MKYMNFLLMTTMLTGRPLVFDGEVSLELSYDDAESVPEAFKTLYTEKDGKFTLTGIKGLKTQTDVNKVSEALRKERADHSKLRATLREAFGEQYDLTDIAERAGKVDELQALVDAGGDPKDPKKIDKLVEARLAAKLAPLERENAQLKTKVGELETENGGFKTEKRTRTIHDAVREAGSKASLLPQAMDDALMLAERQFEIADDGSVVTREGVSVGQGLSPADWFSDMQEKRPHWWGPSTGGGAGGGGLKPGENNPWSAAHWNLTAQGAIVKANPTRAAALASAVGSKIGATAPTVKK